MIPPAGDLCRTGGVHPCFGALMQDSEGFMQTRGPAPQCVGGPFDGDLAPIQPGTNRFILGGHCYALTREDDGSYFWRYTGLLVYGPAAVAR